MPWEPGTLPPEEDLWPDFYAFGVLEELDRRLEVEGLTICITYDVDTLPALGDDVVAIVIDDESATVPDYAPRVRAVFKNLGVRPRLGCRPLREPTRINAMTAAVYLRNVTVWLPSALRYAGARAAARRNGRPRPATLHELPVGTYNLRDRELKDIFDRETTLFFAGSVGHEPGRLAALKSRIAPKSMSRTAMLREAERIAATDPRVTLDAGVTGGFRESVRSDADTYADRLAEAQISLVPRGTTAFTYRFFQSLRYGCVVITDILPSLWYYDEAPVIRLADWSELGGTVAALLDDPARMRTLHARSLAWWREACSEEAVGAQVAAVLNASG
jgi:hypothetical protein